MYALEASSRQTLVPKGSFVVAEGEMGEDHGSSQLVTAALSKSTSLEDADALVLLVSGVTSVLKKATFVLVNCETVKTTIMVCGR